METRTLDLDVCWEAVAHRDPDADGRFFYSVITTGIYCRPSCPARRPRRENVRFHASRGAAERAGFRPCRRCLPQGPSPARRREALVTRACRLLEAGDPPPNLRALARQAGVSPAHFHRLFKAALGVTPKAYAQAWQRQRLQAALGAADSVTDALYSAGFNSSGRFYSTAPGALGMTPTAFRRGGAGTEIRFALGPCSLGQVLVAASELGVCAILLGDDPEALLQDLQGRFAHARLRGGDVGFEHHVAQVVGLIEAPHVPPELPLDIRGTAFQQRVWQALREIPPGATADYSEIAARIGAPRAVRAVAGACAANPLAVAIPCHRVIRRDGGMGGYRWGLDRKRRLLQREAEGNRE